MQARRERHRQLDVLSAETLGVASTVREFEHSREHAARRGGSAEGDPEQLHASLSALEHAALALAGRRHDARHADVLQREAQQQLQRLRARLEHVRATAADHRALAASAADGARRALGALPAVLAACAEVGRQEEALVADTQQGLAAVIKMTAGIDALAEIHGLAVAVEAEQQALLHKVHDLQGQCTRVAGTLEAAGLSQAAAASVAAAAAGGAEGVQAVLGPEAAEALAEAAGEVLAAMGRWHRLLPELAVLALDHVRSDEALGGGGGRDAGAVAPAMSGKEGALALDEGLEEKEGVGEERNKYAVSMLRRVCVYVCVCVCMCVCMCVCVCVCVCMYVCM